MSSTFKVCFTQVKDVQPHPNADRLEIITVYGFQTVASKGTYKVGDTVLYIPVDSILPQKLENLIFGPESKVKLDKHRVRQIRIRQFPSQGLLISKDTVRQYPGIFVDKCKLDEDVSEILSITKYEPPAPQFNLPSQKTGRKKNANNPLFHSYNGLDNIKWYPELFEADELVVVQEKLHGTNARAGLLPALPNTLWKKLKKFLGFNLGYEFCYGSNNVELTNREIFTSNFYGEDVYGAAFAKAEAKHKIKPNEIIYGEIIGEGIQKNYSYGLSKNERKFVLFDVKEVNPATDDYQWLSPIECKSWAEERGFDFVPQLAYTTYGKLDLTKLSTGPSAYDSKQLVKEGVVVKSAIQYNDPTRPSNKRALKFINPQYLDDKSNTDNH